MYKNMFEEVLTLLRDLPIKDSEILDMLMGVSYDRPYTLKEIRTVFYNYFDKDRNLRNTIPNINRLIKRYFDKLKELDNKDVNNTNKKS